MAGSSIDLGIPGLNFSPGDHICAFYPDIDHRDEILIPYLQEGLKAGDKCICVVDGSARDALYAELGTNVDIEPCVASKQLDVQSWQETYLRGDRFSTAEMLDFWDTSISAAFNGGFGFARAVGEMTWALSKLPGVDELMQYEARLNRFLPRYPQVILCLYELGRFSGEVLVDALKTHPKVLIGGMVLRNPYYLDPDEYLARRQ
jgi:hypothetical protein